MRYNGPVRERSEAGVKFNLDVTDDVKGQVKVRMFDYLGLMRLARKISVLEEITTFDFFFGKQ